jgi:hypothetical protein
MACRSSVLELKTKQILKGSRFMRSLKVCLLLILFSQATFGETRERRENAGGILMLCGAALIISSGMVFVSGGDVSGLPLSFGNGAVVVIPDDHDSDFDRFREEHPDLSSQIVRSTVLYTLSAGVLSLGAGLLAWPRRSK